MSGSYVSAKREYKYFAPTNVDHPVFRFYGRILRPDFGMTGERHEKILDFGCGQGAAVNYFHSLGFEAYGVDVLEDAINTCRIRYPYVGNRFFVCTPDPSGYDGFLDTKYDVITAIQSLYYVDNETFDKILVKLHGAMRPGGVFFATMMGSKSRYFYENSSEIGNGLREINFANKRYSVKNLQVNFIENEEQLLQKFRIFKPVHLGFYSDQFRCDEGPGYHYIFCGIKE